MNKLVQGPAISGKTRIGNIEFRDSLCVLTEVTLYNSANPALLPAKEAAPFK